MSLLTWLDRKWRKAMLPPLFILWNAEFVGSKVGAATETMYQHNGAGYVKETTAGMDFYNHAMTYTGFALGSIAALGLPFIYYTVAAYYQNRRYKKFKYEIMSQPQSLLVEQDSAALRYWLRGDIRILNDLLAYDDQQLQRNHAAETFRTRIWHLLQNDTSMGRSVAERILLLANANRVLLERILEVYADELKQCFEDAPKERWILLELVQGDLFLREAVVNFYQKLNLHESKAKAISNQRHAAQEQHLSQDNGYYYELNYVCRPWWWPASLYVSWDARIILGPGGGALIGATVGTFILPGFGSALGYVVGCLLGFIIAFGRDEFFPRWRASLIHSYYKKYQQPPAIVPRRKWYRESSADLPLYAHLFPAAIAGMGIGLAYGAFGALLGVAMSVSLFVVLPYVWSVVRALFHLDHKTAGPAMLQDDLPLIRKAVKMAWWRRSYWDMPASYRYSFGVMLGTVLGVVFPCTAVSVFWTQSLGFGVGSVMAGGLTGGVLALLSPMIIDVIITPIMKFMHPPIDRFILAWQRWLGARLGVLQDNQLNRDPLWVEPDAPWYISAAPAAVATISMSIVLGWPLVWSVGIVVGASLLFPVLYKFIEPVSVWIRQHLDIQFSDAVMWSLRMMGFQSIFVVACTVLGLNVGIGAVAGALFGIVYPYIVGAMRSTMNLLKLASTISQSHQDKQPASSNVAIELATIKRPPLPQQPQTESLVEARSDAALFVPRETGQQKIAGSRAQPSVDEYSSYSQYSHV